MANYLNSANFNGSNGSHFSLILEYDISQSTAENYSDITYYLKMQSRDGYSGGGATSTGSINNAQVGTFSSIGVNTTINIGQRTERIYHNSDGTKTTSYSAVIDTSWTLGDASVSGDLTLPRIDRFATMTDATPNPNDESEFWFKYNNPRNLTLHAWLEVNPVGPWYAERTITNAGTSGTYTWELTEEERNQLRTRMPRSNTGRITIGIKSSIGSQESSSVITRTFTIVNANPIFNNFEFEDINPTTLALTGDSSININGYSNIKATISTNNKAEAIKEATMSKYRFKIGDSSTDITYSDSQSVNGTINNASSGIYEMYAIDSRNNSTLTTKLASQEINYEKIYLDKATCTIERDNGGVGENAILTINGTFWNNNFGAINNSVKSITYRLKKSDSSTWIDGTTTITPTISNNNFSFTDYIASDEQDTKWDLNSSYNIEITAVDELSSTTITSNELTLNSAKPTFSLDKEGVGIMCAYDSSKGGYLQVGGKIIDGGKLLWSNPNPSSSFSQQNITLSSDDYDILEFFYKGFNNSNWQGTTKIIKGASARLIYIAGTSIWYRNCQYVNDTTYSIGNESTGENSRNIPLYVVGYKTNLFS